MLSGFAWGLDEVERSVAQLSWQEEHTKEPKFSHGLSSVTLSQNSRYLIPGEIPIRSSSHSGKTQLRGKNCRWERKRPALLRRGPPEKVAELRRTLSTSARRIHNGPAEVGPRMLALRHWNASASFSGETA